MPEKDLFETERKLGMKVGCWQCSGKLCQNEGPETNLILRPPDTHIMLRKFEGDTKRVWVDSIILSLIYFILFYFPLKHELKLFFAGNGLIVFALIWHWESIWQWIGMIINWISNRSTIWPRCTRICQVYWSYLWIVLFMHLPSQQSAT